MSDFIQNLAITIGINNYTNGISPLTNAKADALKLADILETEHHYQEVIRITEENEAATKEKLLELLKTTLPEKNLTISDRLLFLNFPHTLDKEESTSY